MRHNVVISECRDDWNRETGILLENVEEFPGHDFVQVDDFIHRPRDLLIFVVTGRIASPDHEIDISLEILLDPSESRID